MVLPALRIGDVAARAGLSSPTIRYYESVGLLAPAPRSVTGYRHYSETTVEELRFIKKAQSLGFSLDEIGEILKLSRAGETPLIPIHHCRDDRVAFGKGRPVAIEVQQ